MPVYDTVVLEADLSAPGPARYLAVETNGKSGLSIQIIRTVPPAGVGTSVVAIRRVPSSIFLLHNCRRNVVAARKGSQFDDPGAVVKRFEAIRCDLQCGARLADTTGTDKRDEPVCGHQPAMCKSKRPVEVRESVATRFAYTAYDGWACK